MPCNILKYHRNFGARNSVRYFTMFAKFDFVNLSCVICCLLIMITVTAFDITAYKSSCMFPVIPCISTNPFYPQKLGFRISPNYMMQMTGAAVEENVE